MNSIWNYNTIEETINVPHLGSCLTYGIQAGCKTAGGWKEVALIHDVTTEPELAERLAALFNRHQLSPVHLRDALENLLP